MTINVFRNVMGGGGGKGSKGELYSSYLRSEGYLPEVDRDGDIVFKVEGGSYILFANDKDREYFSLLFPNFWPIENERERTVAYAAACQTTATTKVAKVYLVGDNVSASVELIFGDPEQFKAVFKRALVTLQGSVAVFAEKMRELK